MSVCNASSKMLRDFHKKYDYLTADQVKELYDSALALYLQLSYPFDKSITQLPEDCARDVYIIRMIMTETLERDGLSSVTAYSENGMSFTFDNAHISSQIVNLITPHVKGVGKA